MKFLYFYWLFWFLYCIPITDNFKLFHFIRTFNKKTTNNFKDINGFYGLIGGEKTNQVSISGDGIIQCVFIENGKVQKFIKNPILTDRRKFMNSHPLLSQYLHNNWFGICIYILKMFNMLNIHANFDGRANTGLYYWKNARLLLALHERDNPYGVFIDFHNNNLLDYGKINSNSIHRKFSAHPYEDLTKSEIVSATYNLLGCKKGTVITQYDIYDLSPKQSYVIPTKYNSIVHDIISTENNVYIPDCPLVIDYCKIMQPNSPIPMKFDKKQKSRIGIWNKATQTTQWIQFNYSFFTFHFVDVNENIGGNENITYIDVCLFDNINMDRLNENLPQLYRLAIDKSNSSGIVYKKIQLKNEIYTDFPTKLNGPNGEKHLLLTLELNETKTILMSGFVILDRNLKTMTHFKLPGNESSFCGQLSFHEKTKSIIGFCNIDNGSYFFLYDLQSKQVEYQLITELDNSRIGIQNGFHSIFIDR
jgi:hypothetical protein